MKYKSLLFDVDDTLLDFQKTEKNALQALFDEQKMVLTQEIELMYKEINHRLWHSFELGEIEKSTITQTRFSELFRRLNQQVDGVQLENSYRTYVSQGHELLGNSYKIIEQLASDYELYIVTNGVAKTQYQRLNDANLTPFFKRIFVSEEVGYQKPMKEYFSYVFDQIGHFDKKKTLLIGDSLASDIAGGNRAHIETVWLNSTNQTPSETIHPTYEIRQLDDLFRILTAED